MKSLKITLIILFSIFLVDKIVYFSLKRIDDKVFTGGMGRLNHFFLVKDTTQFLFFGNSRTHYHINPDFFGKSSFNIGVGGRKIAFSTALIKTLPKNKEQFIFVQVDSDNIFDTEYAGEDIKVLNIMQHKNNIISESIKEINMDNPFSTFLWSLDYNGVCLSLISNRLRPRYDYKKFNGYEPLSNTKEQKQIFINKLKKIKQTKCNDIYLPSELVKKYVVEIKEFCKKNNKHLIFFTSPVYKDECQKDNQALSRMMNDFGLEYHDFTSLFDSNSDLDLWRDENHLSKKGADLFSELMFEKLKDNLN